MRLSYNKIGYLSNKILKMIQDNPEIHILSNSDLVTRSIDDSIVENMRLEEEIDEEVESIITTNVNEIRAMEMDVGALRNKIKREICKKRNFRI